MKYLIILLSLVFASCGKEVSSTNIENTRSENDTAIILKYALQYALVDSNIPNMNFLPIYPDSIIIINQDIDRNLFPILDSFQFKFRTKLEICNEARKANTNKIFPQYLRIKQLFNGGDSAVISIVNECVDPNYQDSLGNCDGFLCRSGCALIFTKTKGKWTYKDFGKWES